MRILVAGWDSGGGVEAVQTVVQRAVRRGHQVRVLGTEGLRSLAGGLLACLDRDGQAVFGRR
jgi:phage terminase large subunit GpA-like protein